MRRLAEARTEGAAKIIVCAKLFEKPATLKRNLSAIKFRDVAISPPNQFSAMFNKDYNQSVADMIAGKKDINTALRDLQDEVQKQIDAAP
jgi:hypothetical protein